MRVDQAIYGAVRNGHGLRCASGDQKFASELELRLDLPETAPPNVDWSPFTSGFATGRRYVIARTFSDPSAGRAGMVIAHALICDVDDIVMVDDLRLLASHFITSPDYAPTEVAPLDIVHEFGEPPITPELPAVAQALVTPGSGPVVRLGTDGFEELVIALWGQLWPSLRRNLYFRLSFGPNDVAETSPPTIVCTPASLVGRWHQHRIAGQAGGPSNDAAHMIDGSAAGEQMRGFAAGIGAKLDSFGELRMLEQAGLLTTSNPDDVSSLASAARLVERLSPDPAEGDTAKRAIIDRLVAALPSAKPSEILKLRNLALPGFATGDRVWEAVETWLEGSEYPVSVDIEMVAIVNDALASDDAHVGWRQAVKRGLESSLGATGSGFQRAFWRWAEADPGTAPALVDLVAGSAKALASTVAAAPTELAAATAKPIIEAAKRLKLFDLHAVAAGASMGVVEAARAQSRIEPGNDVSAMRLAVRRAKPDEILDAVAEINDTRLLAIAGEAVAKTPTLLAKRQMSADANRRIWSSALETNPDAWQGPVDPRNTFDELLAEQIDGKNPPAKLLDQLSTTPLADVTSFSRRGELWQHLPNTVRDRLFAATVDAWFSRTSADKQYLSVEPDLARLILADARLDELLAKLSTGRIADGLRIIEALGGVDETKFRNWISAAVKSTRPVPRNDADLIGRTVAAQRRRDIVGDLVPIYRRGRSDLDPVLRHCVSLIDFWDRWFLGLSPISTAEKWESLVELAAQLYPNGPDQEDLWERSGGRNADLNRHGSGRERWRAALRSIENGRLPRVGQLIHQMLDDYSGNPNLRLLANDPLFRS